MFGHVFGSYIFFEGQNKIGSWKWFVWDLFVRWDALFFHWFIYKCGYVWSTMMHQVILFHSFWFKHTAEFDISICGSKHRRVTGQAGVQLLLRSIDVPSRGVNVHNLNMFDLKYLCVWICVILFKICRPVRTRENLGVVGDELHVAHLSCWVWDINGDIKRPLWEHVDEKNFLDWYFGPTSLNILNPSNWLFQRTFWKAMVATLWFRLFPISPKRHHPRWWHDLMPQAHGPQSASSGCRRALTKVTSRRRLWGTRYHHNNHPSRSKSLDFIPKLILICKNPCRSFSGWEVPNGFSRWKLLGGWLTNGIA